MMNTEQSNDAEVDSQSNPEHESQNVPSKIEAFKWMLLSRWGVLFRAVFIISLGAKGYFWLDPQSIGDVPFAELTFNQVAENCDIDILVGHFEHSLL